MSSSVFCCLPKLAAPGGGFCPRALSARAAACWHAAYALHNSRGRHSRRTQEALEFASQWPCLQQNQREFLGLPVPPSEPHFPLG